MKIGIDCRDATKIAGKGQYVRQLVSHLLQITNNIQWYVYTDQPLAWLPNSTQVTQVILPGGWRYHLALWKELERKRMVDLFFAPTSFTVPFFLRRTPYVLAIMDMVSWKFMAWHNRKAVILEKLLGPSAMRRAQKLLAISESTKRDVVKILNISADKIIVTSLAPSLTNITSDAPLSVERPYFLYLGALEPRKNLIRLVDAYENAYQQESALPQLVLAGPLLWGSDKIVERIARSPIKDNISVLGSVTEPVKISLIKNALAFIFPSLYEGFGLPPLEAMTLGVPVLTSNTSSLPEVVGEAGILVNPLKTSEIASGLLRLAQDSELRERLIQAGLAQATKFDWKKTATITLDALQKCVSQN